MKKVKLILIGCISIISIAHGQIESASSIVEKARDKTLVDALEATITLTITDKNGNTRIRTNKIISKKYPDGTEKRLIKFTAPAEVQGTALLVHDYRESQDDMWIYLPALKRIRRIVSSEKGKSFMGSEFSNADISSPPAADFINKHLDGSGKDGKYIIESVPVDAVKAGEYGFAKKISYYDAGNLYLNKMEFFDRYGSLFKTIEIVSVESPGPGDGYIITEMSATNHKTDRSSTMKMDIISTDVRPDDSIFDAQNLDR
jgi:hypothetical protein